MKIFENRKIINYNKSLKAYPPNAIVPDIAYMKTLRLLHFSDVPETVAMFFHISQILPIIITVLILIIPLVLCQLFPSLTLYFDYGILMLFPLIILVLYAIIPVVTFLYLKLINKTKELVHINIFNAFNKYASSGDVITVNPACYMTVTESEITIYRHKFSNEEQIKLNSINAENIVRNFPENSVIYSIKLEDIDRIIPHKEKKLYNEKKLKGTRNGLIEISLKNGKKIGVFPYILPQTAEFMASEINRFIGRLN